MDPHASRLRDWLAASRVRAEHLVFDVSCHSVAEAALAASAREDEFIKSICMITEAGSLAVAIVKGEDRASTTRVGQALGTAERPRLAMPEEMLARSGYPAGGTPPLGFEAMFLMDERVMVAPTVYGGGGSDRALIRIAPAELHRANAAQITRIRK